MELKAEQVRGVFALRAQGKSYKAIAKQMPFSTNTVARILRRDDGFGNKVIVDTAVLADAAKVGRAPSVRKCRKHKPTDADLKTALTDYVSAAIELRRAKQAARTVGVDEDTLALLASSCGL